MIVYNLLDFNKYGQLDKDEFTRWYLTGMKPKSKNFVMEEFINNIYRLFSQFKQLQQIRMTQDIYS